MNSQKEKNTQKSTFSGIICQNVVSCKVRKKYLWASLVVKWLKICLPLQGTWVQPLVWKDPICFEATNPCGTTTEPVLQSPTLILILLPGSS